MILMIVSFSSGGVGADTDDTEGGVGADTDDTEGGVGADTDDTEGGVGADTEDIVEGIYYSKTCFYLKTYSLKLLQKIQTPQITNTIKR